MGRLLLTLAGGLLFVVPPLRAATCTGNCPQEIVANKRYNYEITATATHCSDASMPCPTPGNAIRYSWPVTNFLRDNATHEPLDAFLQGINDQIFTLPFSDPFVVRMNGWLYMPNDWHHAFDYARLDGRTFPVRAAAPGRVIFAGWDGWSGNTVIVSHDAGGVVDAYRTIYMHMRNGPSHDCDMSWRVSVNATDPKKPGERESYKAFLRGTGCTERWWRSPKAPYWGTRAQTIDANLVGRTVARGEQLGWAGATGPGGQKAGGPPNTHLHIFFARKRTTDNEWFFFDPYGIYGQPHCYPVAITERPEGDCVRLPVAWLGGRPDYPGGGTGTSGGCGSGPACLPGFQCQGGLCKPACVCPPGCRVNAEEQCVKPEGYTERQDCKRILGVCGPPCFTDANGSCKVEVPKTREVPCALQCPP